MSKPYKVLSLFCGCGGIDYGFHLQNEFEVKAAFDILPAAVETYNLNFPGTAKVQDIQKLLESSFDLSFIPDVIVGGPPCQDFSIAGKRMLGPRANLTQTYVDIVAKYKPKYFVMENVPSIRTVGKAIYDSIVEQFCQQGYALTSQVIFMPDYGVPQRRKRLLMIGVLDSQNPYELLHLFEKHKSPVKTMKDYFDKIGVELDKPYIYRHPRLNHCRSVYSIEKDLYPTVRGCIRGISRSYRPNPKNSTEVLDDIFVPDWKTAALLQTFPVDYNWLPVNNAQIVGNAVPPLFSVTLARILLEHLSTTSRV